MRIEGTLKRWNDDKGFGFIAPAQGGPDVFVHVSAYPRDGSRPVEGEPLTYEVETGADGRLKAMRVSRHRAQPVHANKPSEPLRSHGPRTSSTRLPPLPVRRSATTPILLVAVILVALGAWGYHTYVRSRAVPVMDAPVLAVPAPPSPRVTTLPPVEKPVPAYPPQVAPVRVPRPEPVSRFSCDGRKYCSQMTSCAEAEYFLQHCPGVKMDGNHDGEPCEEQWCTR